MPIDLGTSAALPRETWTIEAIPLTGLTEEERALAQVRLNMLMPHLLDGVSLAHIEREVGCTQRTLRRWREAYHQHGLAGLVPHSRSDRGCFRLTEDVKFLIEGLALQKHRPSIRSVYRNVKDIAEQKGWPVPSYRTVATVVGQLSPGMMTLAHEGSKAYSAAYEMVYRREAARPNEVWQADHTPLDIWVLDERGQADRPWLTVILDDYSRAVMGWRLSFKDPSALQTSLTLRQAIWRKGDVRWHVCGIPEVFYTDHGSDFTSRHLEQVALDLKMQAIFSTVARPQGRGKIERFFGVVNELFLCEQPGYTPPKTAPAKPSLTITELEERLELFFLDDYHLRVHPETGAAPQARWEAGGFLPRMPESLEQLDLLLLTVVRTRMVRRDGIYFQSLRYLDPTLAAFIGETVTIRYDPCDLAEIRVFHGDRFLCRAICQELSGEVVSLNEIVQARRSRRRELQDEIKSRARIVDRLMALKGARSTTLLPLPPSTSEPRLKRYINDD